MTTERKHDKVRSRNESFTERTSTKICQESPSEDNSYIAKSQLCYGYEIFELSKKRSFVDCFYLILKGELPTIEEAHLLETLMIQFINPGPRDNATRAAMNAGVGKTDPMHILPIALSVAGGTDKGGACIDSTMRFFRKTVKKDPEDYIKSVNSSGNISEALPGFGSLYGGVDVLTNRFARELGRLPAAGPALKWGNVVAEFTKKMGVGWLRYGLAAAVFSDLGFHPRVGGGVFQLLGAPGMLAHGVEVSNKPFTAMPFIKDENYVIEK